MNKNWKLLFSVAIGLGVAFWIGVIWLVWYFISNCRGV